jgi:hypothetical protein
MPAGMYVGAWNLSLSFWQNALTNVILILYSFNSTYYGKDYRAGAALLRARRPYLVKNTLTGIALFSFCIGVCMYLPP